MKNINDEIEELISNYGKKQKNMKILDIGCGTGNYTYFFCDNNNVTGIDIQNVVKKELLKFDFKIVDATNLFFADNFYDLIVSFDVIEHIAEDEKMISEAYRVLKNGGKIFLGTPNKNRLSHALLKLVGKEVKYPLNLGVNKDLGDTIHLREYNAFELKILVENAGFKNIKIKSFWLGVTLLKYGLVNPPKFLQKYCQYLFIEATK